MRYVPTPRTSLAEDEKVESRGRFASWNSLGVGGRSVPVPPRRQKSGVFQNTYGFDGDRPRPGTAIISSRVLLSLGIPVVRPRGRPDDTHIVRTPTRPDYRDAQ